jgi:short-subunit dehydrogenase
MPRALRDRVVVITGASSGIGAATAVACGREGMRVAVAARRKEHLERVAADVRAAGGEVRVVPTDVCEEAAVQALIDETVAAWGRLDVLVNNAGIGMLAPTASTSAAEFEAIMRVNYLGTVHGVLAALPHMRRQGGGHIVNVASVVGKRASPFRTAYVASKFAVVGLSEALRMELRQEGISVTAICPIGTATEFHELEVNRLGVSGRGGPIQTAEHVARGIVRALRRPRPEVHPYPPARLLFLMNSLAPGLVDRLMMAVSPKARQR